MSTAQEKFVAAIATKLRADTGADSLVALTKHDASNPNQFRISRDKKVGKGETPFLGVLIFQSVPLMDDGPSHVQKARVYFRCYATEELTTIQIADRMEHLLHGRDEQQSPGLTNVGYYDVSDSSISNRQTRWKGRSEPDFDDDTDVYMVLIEAEMIWVDEDEVADAKVDQLLSDDGASAT
mgnify:CR=1 FL=1